MNSTLIRFKTGIVREDAISYVVFHQNKNARVHFIGEHNESNKKAGLLLVKEDAQALRKHFGVIQDTVN